ncbi:hypothetical protein OIU77_015437 [Salix suchowensis]|uniref:Uncharacterized protein n=1 Tax=Salix suchowensis TaxID=1278906 RepID=A0ABQ8ZGY4_9ROSI|nr:hypothetical protein OIU77_015437 [Salix suchowensis]
MSRNHVKRLLEQWPPVVVENVVFIRVQLEQEKGDGFGSKLVYMPSMHGNLLCSIWIYMWVWRVYV